MNDPVVGVLALLLFVACAILYGRIRCQGASYEEPWLPRALRGSELAYSERKFSSPKHGLVARLDRAYRGNGALHLVELKTRDYVAALASDVIELSVQRLVLQEATGEPVSLQAFVAIKKGGVGLPQPVPVTLFEEAQVMRMRERLLEVREGRSRPASPARRPRACDKCGHFAACAKTYGDRRSLPRTAGATATFN